MERVNFQEQVLQRSFQVPVVVDFWASWCGPCRVLGPVIEAMANEANGKWELVKIDTEAEQHIARQYKIMSIPAVKMFFQGQVIAEFAGALPRPQIQRWLDQHLPNPGKMALQSLTEGWDSQDPESWRQALMQYLVENPQSEEARAWTALSLLAAAPKEATDLLQYAPPSAQMLDFHDDIRTLADMLAKTAEGTSPAFELTWNKAREAFRTHHIEQALAHLIEAVMLNKEFEAELPRRAAVALFRRLGQAHPVSKAYQRRFSMALY